MKVCITAQGPTTDALVEERFGRAPYFILIDTETGSYEAVPNPYAQGAGGVGPKAAQMLIDHKATVLISGQVGGNAREVLAAAGIEMHSCAPGIPVSEALAQFRK